MAEILESAKSGMVDPYRHLSRLQLLQVVDHKEKEIADMRKKLESKEVNYYCQSSEGYHDTCCSLPTG